MNEPHPDERIRPITTIPFFAVHVGALVGAILYPPSAPLVIAAVVSYYVRMFGVTAGYHRYFAHRSFRTGRAFQFFLALLGTLSLQKGVLWWAAHHRAHHKHSDQEEDIHSPTRRGFWWAHWGWILSDRYLASNHDAIRDFARYPELRWLDRHFLLPPVVAGALIWLVAGPAMFFWAGLVSTVALWHGTFFINSLAHVFGRRRYETSPRDTSRNSMLLALITSGEGWHNNHHYYPAAARNGFFWWEIDLTWYVLRALSAVGLVWGLKVPPRAVLAGNRAGGADIGARGRAAAPAAPPPLAPAPLPAPPPAAPRGAAPALRGPRARATMSPA